MTITVLTAALAIASGCAIGSILALIGGGGSILAVPLLVYLVGVTSPHVAIGTAAIAVALNAALGLAVHAQRGTVFWRCGLIFAAAGVVGAAAGAGLGKTVDGRRLLALFGLLMIVIGINMVRPLIKAAASAGSLPDMPARTLTLRLLLIGLAAGLLAGFFGIGGGFLIVPGLMFAAGMPIVNAIGTSLLGVTAFGLTTTVSYAASGLVDWPLAALVVLGGALGSQLGSRANAALGQDLKMLTRLFAGLVIVVGLAVVAKGLPHLMGRM
jgi:uncharacterized protein